MTLPTAMQNTLINWLEQLNYHAEPNEPMFLALCTGLLLSCSIFAYLIARFVLYFKIVRLVHLTKNKIDDELLKHGVFRGAAHLISGLTAYLGQSIFFASNLSFASTISNIINLYLGVTIYVLLQRALSAGNSIYQYSQLSQKAPITGFIQVARLLFTLALVFFIVSTLLGKSPIYLLSGLTAVAAVLLLIFRDTILGFVAGIQIAANRMFNTGDWIEIPKYGVDGDIIEIGLTVVKVQNWDKTISTLPTHALTSDAVKNWRGMKESGGRRIKRSINIDMRGIAFANAEQMKRWSSINLLHDYLNNKNVELQEDLARCESNNLNLVNSRKLTNVGTFRAYIEAYLSNHNDLNHDMTCMVRQLKPSDNGLPLEIYCFSKNQVWVEYERIQSDIFDHILAIMPIFELNAYQRVSNSPKRLKFE